MSKTYRKNVRQPMGGGNNRSFYKIRRKKNKHAIKNELRHLVSNYEIDEVDEIILNPKIIKKDTWLEPTDGHILVNKTTIDNLYEPDYYHKKYDKVLKDKH